MLKDHLYTLLSAENSENILTATVQLNLAHAIFKGHFPDQPVVPGVCLMQIVKEVLEEQVAQSLLLMKADYLKFIAPVIPEDGKQLQLQLKYSVMENGIYKVSAILVQEDSPCFKIQGYFSTH